MRSRMSLRRSSAGRPTMRCRGSRPQRRPLAAGELVALGVTTAPRSPAFPNVPTLAEAGASGYDFPIWYGAWARADTRPAIVDGLTSDIADAIAHPERKRLPRHPRDAAAADDARGVQGLCRRRSSPGVTDHQSAAVVVPACSPREPGGGAWGNPEMLPVTDVGTRSRRSAVGLTSLSCLSRATCRVCLFTPRATHSRPAATDLPPATTDLAGKRPA
jgi:hypothetical protein